MDVSFVSGLAAFGFWLFVGAAAVAGVWDGIRKRDAEHETLRRLAESGQPVDEQLIRLIAGPDKQTWRDLRIAGLICLGVAPGLALLGLLVGIQSPGAILPLFGVGLLVFCIAGGLLAAARFARGESDQEVRS